MAKRKSKHAKSHRTTLRIKDDTMLAVTKIENATGWSQGAAVAFLCDAGIDALYSDSKGISSMRRVLTAAIDVQMARKQAEGMMSVHTRALAEARKQMNDQLVPPADIPERPADRPVIISPKKRGRPRKNPENQPGTPNDQLTRNASNADASEEPGAT